MTLRPALPARPLCWASPLIRLLALAALGLGLLGPGSPSARELFDSDLGRGADLVSDDSFVLPSDGFGSDDFGSDGLGWGPLDGGTPCPDQPGVTYLSNGCTGIQVSERIVLTAAHCVDPSDTSDLSVGLGPFCGVGEASAQVTRRHPLYHTSSNAYDLAVIGLSGTLSGSQPVAIDLGRQASGSTVTIAGRGRNRNGGGDRSVRCANAQVVGDAGRAFREVLMDDGRVCGGDSGGPVITADGRVTGVVAATEGLNNCRRRNRRAFYAEFAEMSSFITSTIAAVQQQLDNGQQDPCSPTGSTRSCRPAGSACLDDSSGGPLGVCQLGTQTCSGGAWGACSGFVGPTVEICHNGLDENCDGLADEGCLPEGCPPITCPAGTQHDEVTCTCQPIGFCGDGVCSTAELVSQSCPVDCSTSSTCGDGFCEFPWESEFNCAIDCDPGQWCTAVCGDGVCECGEDEASTYCSADCGGGGGGGFDDTWEILYGLCRDQFDQLPPEWQEICVEVFEF